MITGDELQEIANAQGHGYLKSWKAHSMVGTLKDLPLKSDRERLRRWVANCLEMEGFTPSGIDAVTDAIMNEDRLQEHLRKTSL